MGPVQLTVQGTIWGPQGRGGGLGGAMQEGPSSGLLT